MRTNFCFERKVERPVLRIAVTGSDVNGWRNNQWRKIALDFIVVVVVVTLPKTFLYSKKNIWSIKSLNYSYQNLLKWEKQIRKFWLGSKWHRNKSISRSASERVINMSHWFLVRMKQTYRQTSIKTHSYTHRTVVCCDRQFICSQAAAQLVEAKTKMKQLKVSARF